MLDRKVAEELRLKTEANGEKFKFSSIEREKAFGILSNYMKEKEFSTSNEAGQQKLLASACRMMVESGIDELKATVFISNAHGRVSGSNGNSKKSLNNLMGIR